MRETLESLIIKNQERLADAIVKDAVRQIPAYQAVTLRQTIDRVDLWLATLAASLTQNNPKILAGYLVTVARERYGEGFSIGELHMLVEITETRLRELISAGCQDQVHCNALQALLQAVMGAARMTISAAILLREKYPEKKLI